MSWEQRNADFCKAQTDAQMAYIEAEREVNRLQAENEKLTALVCHLYYVKPRDITSVMVNGEVLRFDELMAEVGLRWEGE